MKITIIIAAIGVFGAVGDTLTTSYGILSGIGYENNPYAATLIDHMGMPLWGFVMTCVCLIPAYFVIRKPLSGSNWIIFVAAAFVCFIKGGVVINNILQLISPELGLH